jgi:hypothetical protein
LGIRIGTAGKIFEAILGGDHSLAVVVRRRAEGWNLTVFFPVGKNSKGEVSHETEAGQDPDKLHPEESVGNGFPDSRVHQQTSCSAKIKNERRWSGSPPLMSPLDD